MLHSTYFIRPPCFTPHVYRSSHWFSNYQNWFTIAPRCARAAGRPKLEAGQNQSKAMFCRASERASECPRLCSPPPLGPTGAGFAFFPNFQSDRKLPIPIHFIPRSSARSRCRRRRHGRAGTTSRSGGGGASEQGRRLRAAARRGRRREGDRRPKGNFLVLEVCRFVKLKISLFSHNSHTN